MAMKVYISGKIGEDVLSEAMSQKFAKAEAYLREWGFDTFNPTASGLGKQAEERAKANGTDFYTEIMELDIAELKKCDAIYMLTDWRDSAGAQREYKEAQRNGIQVFYETKD